MTRKLHGMKVRIHLKAAFSALARSRASFFCCFSSSFAAAAAAFSSSVLPRPPRFLQFTVNKSKGQVCERYDSLPMTLHVGERSSQPAESRRGFYLWVCIYLWGLGGESASKSRYSELGEAACWVTGNSGG